MMILILIDRFNILLLFICAFKLGWTFIYLNVVLVSGEALVETRVTLALVIPLVNFIAYLLQPFLVVEKAAVFKVVLRVTHI